MPEPSSTLAYLLSDEPTNPVVDAALEEAEKLARMLRHRKRLSAREAMFLVMLRRIRELEEENQMLKRLR